MEKAQISQKFYKQGGGQTLDFVNDSESQNQKLPKKRENTTALDTFMVVDKIKITKFQQQNV